MAMAMATRARRETSKRRRRKGKGEKQDERVSEGKARSNDAFRCGRRRRRVVVREPPEPRTDHGVWLGVSRAEYGREVGG